MRSLVIDFCDELIASAKKTGGFNGVRFFKSHNGTGISSPVTGREVFASARTVELKRRFLSLGVTQYRVELELRVCAPHDGVEISRLCAELAAYFEKLPQVRGVKIYPLTYSEAAAAVYRIVRVDIELEKEDAE